MDEATREFLKKSGSKGGKKKWANKTKEERSEIMKEVRRKGLESKK